MFFRCERRETGCRSGPDGAQHVSHAHQRRYTQRCRWPFLSSSTPSSTIHAGRGGASRTLRCVFFCSQTLIFLFFSILNVFFFSHTLGRTLTFVILFYFLGCFIPFCKFSLCIIFASFLFLVLFLKLFFSLHIRIPNVVFGCWESGVRKSLSIEIFCSYFLAMATKMDCNVNTRTRSTDLPWKLLFLLSLGIGQKNRHRYFYNSNCKCFLKWKQSF